MNALPKPNDPLVLADGTKIDPVSGRVIREDKQIVEIPTNSEAQNLVIQTRRTVADLPDLPNTMNPINIVLCYDLFGMQDAQIAVATGLTVEQVESIKTHDAYTKMRKAVAENVVNATEDELTQIVASGKTRAARKLVSLIDDSDPDIAIKASKSILDQAGRAQQNETMDELGIRIIRKGAHQSMPVININLGD